MEPKRATLQDLMVERDEEGNVRPIEAHSPMLDRTLLIRPLTYGFVRSTDMLSKPVMDWPIERKVAMLRDHLIEPSCKGLTVEGANQNMNPMVIDHLVAMIMVKSAPFSKLQGQMGALAPLEIVNSALKASIHESNTKRSTTGSTPSATSSPAPAISDS